MEQMALKMILSVKIEREGMQKEKSGTGLL